MTDLKDGTTADDPRLDRLIEFDERSRNFALADIIERQRPRSYTWRVLPDYVIDQGQEGACVGFAVANELQARPAEVDLGGVDAANQFSVRDLYWEAQKIDPWDGGSYPGASPQYGGTSVLAGIKVAQRLGFFEAYYWTFTLEDLVLGLGRHGPAILGLVWFDTNYTPPANGFISPDGRAVGGHAVLARAVKIVWLKDSDRETFDDVDLDASYVTVRNSWGPWGYRRTGDFFVTLRDLGRWLDMQGEAVFADNRTTDPA